LNKITERIIDKYTLIPIVVMLMAVTYLVVGLSDVNIGILAGDIALFAMAVIFAQEIRKAMKTKASKELLKSESPLDWLKLSIEFFVFSLLSSLVYGIVNVQDVGIESNPLIEYSFVFCITFFLLGLLCTVRITWFIIDPSSKANILAGKILKTTVDIGFRAIIGTFIVFFQIFNGIMLYLVLGLIFVLHTAPTPIELVYLPTLVLSFVAVIPLLYEVIFRFSKKTRSRYWVSMLFFFSPWILLITNGLLLHAGIYV
jgi:hypothetical protein